VAHQQKTEKSMTELQLEQNLKFDFSMTTEDGKQLEPRFGPGYTGLKNLGNSCYMASVLQSLFNLEKFQQRYDLQLKEHAMTCTQESPANCWYCQLHKLAGGLMSGRYSQPISNDEGVQSQDGIAPGMFKTLVGKNHEEFSTMRQQDAYEFFQFLCKTVQQKEFSNNQNDPTKSFEFETEQRVQCGKCKKVRYQKDQTTSISINVPARKVENSEEYEPVQLTECLDLFVQEETVDGYQCPNCNEKTTASR
jgi:ubiquitin carboxyl-terminal hydrolase 5/13